ncbi:uncharacterized protein [Periplaneta americana]|uniref:uncharacterized protein n=1 Tax=Periplaneta americana TaxID=6978 RepID=UPI0037E91C60
MPKCAVSSTQKFLVQQHITTSKHQANKQLNSKQRQLFLTQPTTSNVRSEFNIDLCRSLISADIPLYKLKNKVFREFLEKYTQHTIPDESTLRKTYAPSIYDETIQKIRDEIKDSSIWVSIDETPDKEGRLVGNVVIGLLSEQYSERILLHCDVLEKCNNKTIVKLFNEAMGILWPKGIMYDNVLFFISDAAPYMVKAGQALSVVYPKLTHFTCVAHAFHRVAEVVRDNFPKVDLLISSVKKVFLKAPSRVNVLKEMYPEIPLPPKPILTRWGTWLEAVEYYAEHIDSINNVLLALDSEDAVSIDTAKTVTCDISVKNDLAHIQHTFSCIIKTLKSLQNRHLSLSERSVEINIHSLVGRPAMEPRVVLNLWFKRHYCVCVRACCARPHTARRTAAVLTEFGLELLDHPPYSPDLAPSDFHIFLHLKKFLSSGERFGNDEELKKSVTRWFHSQAA